MWAALRHSARVIAATNALGFAVTAVTQSHKITDLCGTASFALSAWATHSAAARCGAQQRRPGGSCLACLPATSRRPLCWLLDDAL